MLKLVDGVPGPDLTLTSKYNVVDISVPSTTMNDIRLDISNNDVQGARQIIEFEVYSR